MQTVQHMLSVIRGSGLTDADIGEKLDGTPAATVYRLRVGEHQKTNYERYALIESLYKSVERKKPKSAA